MKKILGIVLLAVGLIMIFYSVLASYQIFTAQKEVPQIFEVSSPETSIPTTESSSQVEQQIQESIQQQIGNMFPKDFSSDLLNLIAWSVFAGILIFAGAQVSGLGVKLMK